MEVVSSSSSSNSHAGKSGGKATTKRLQSELMQLMMSGDKDATAFPQGDNLFEWLVTLGGAKRTDIERLA